MITPSVDGDSSNACAVAIGFMAYDLVSMLWNYEASVRSNGKGLFHLYVWHHVLSILFWPVAILNRAFVYFVNWFILSEHSSFWLSLRGSMLTLGTINTPAGLFVQLAFVVSFFGARVAVMPDTVDRSNSSVFPSKARLSLRKGFTILPSAGYRVAHESVDDYEDTSEVLDLLVEEDEVAVTATGDFIGNDATAAYI